MSAYNFAAVLKDAGFAFDANRGESSIRWPEIRAIDVDEVIRQRDFETIELHLNDVIEVSLEAEFDLRILDSGFVKLFRLAQLSAEYLLRCRNHLNLLRAVDKEETLKMDREMDYLRKQFKQGRVKRRSRYDDIFKGGQQNYPAFRQCLDCDKIFIDEHHLGAHEKRRHPQIKEAKEAINTQEKLQSSPNDPDETPKVTQEDFAQWKIEQESKASDLKKIMAENISSLQNELSAMEKRNDHNSETVKRMIDQLKNQIQISNSAPSIEAFKVQMQSDWQAKFDSLEKQNLQIVEKLTAFMRDSQSIQQKYSDKMEALVAEQNRIHQLHQSTIGEITKRVDTLHLQAMAKIASLEVKSYHPEVNSYHPQSSTSESDSPIVKKPPSPKASPPKIVIERPPRKVKKRKKKPKQLEKREILSPVVVKEDLKKLVNKQLEALGVPLDRNQIPADHFNAHMNSILRKRQLEAKRNKGFIRTQEAILKEVDSKMYRDESKTNDKAAALSSKFNRSLEFVGSIFSNMKSKVVKSRESLIDTASERNYSSDSTRKLSAKSLLAMAESKMVPPHFEDTDSDDQIEKLLLSPIKKPISSVESEQRRFSKKAPKEIEIDIEEIENRPLAQKSLSEGNLINSPKGVLKTVSSAGSINTKKKVLFAEDNVAPTPPTIPIPAPRFSTPKLDANTESDLDLSDWS